MPTIPQDPSHLDWNDPVAVRRFFTDLRVALDDAEAVTRDTLRPYRRRRLGPAEHRRLHREAADNISFLLAYALPTEDA